MATPKFEHAEARYRMLMENLSDVICTVDMEIHPTYITPSITQLLGYSVAEAMNIPLEKIFTPDSFDLAMKTLSKDIAQEGSKPGVSRYRTLELDMIHKDGTIVSIEGRLTFRRDTDGHPVEIVAVMRDITERKRAKEGLRENEFFLNTLLDAIPIPVFYKDREGKYIGFNKAFEGFFGGTKEQLIGKSVFDINPPDLAEIYHAKDRELMESGGVQKYESQVENASGDRREVIFNKAAFHDHKGHLGGLIGTVLDITERKRMEQEIRRQNEKLQLINMELHASREELKINLKEVAEARVYSEALIRSIGEGLLMIDFDGIVQDANDIYLDLSGFKREEVVGQPMKLDTIATEKGRQEAIKRFRGIKAGEQVGTTEIDLFDVRGETIHLEINRNLVRNVEGDPFMILVTMRDITKRKRAELEIHQRNRELEALNKIAAAVSQSYDLDQIMKNALNRVMEISGMELGAIVQIDEVGALVLKAYRGLSQDIIKAYSEYTQHTGLVKIAIESKKPILVEDISSDPRVINKDVLGKAKFKVLALIPLRAKEKIMGILCVMSKKSKQIAPVDVQLLETIGDQLGVAMENARLMHEVAEVDALREVDHLRSQLLSTVSHELRTPLATIKGYANMLLEYDAKINPDEKRQHLESIDKASNRLTDLIDQLLDMARMESGKLKMPKSPVDISELIQAAVAGAAVRAPDHHIEVKLAKSLPQVSINAEQIRRVLDNLINNATKYSMPGTKVTVSAACADRELIVHVEDQGIGIPAKDLVKIFEPMYRADSPLSVKAGGVGLGLSISKALVEAHGGRIWMKTKKGKGSTCFFTLPLARETDSDQK